jgi:hypothetical protein
MAIAGWFRNKTTAIAASLGVAIVTLPGLAAPPPQVFRDAANRMYIYLLPAGSTLDIQSNGSRVFAYGRAGFGLIRDYRADHCGLVKIPLEVIGHAEHTIHFADLTFVNGDSLPLESLPRCVDNQLSDPRPTNFRTETHLVLVGREPGTYTTVSVAMYQTHRLNINDCGFVRVPESLQAFFWNNTSYRAARLPVAQPPLCQRGTLYIPDGWR